MGDFIVETDGSFNNQSSGSESTSCTPNLNGDFVVESTTNCCNESSSSSGTNLTSAIIYDGVSMSCIGVSNGMTLNQIINLLNVNCNTVNTALGSLSTSITNILSSITTINNSLNSLTSDNIEVIDTSLTCTAPLVSNPTLTEYLIYLDTLFCDLQSQVSAGITGNYLPLPDWKLFEIERTKPHVWLSSLDSFGKGSESNLSVVIASGRATANGETTVRTSYTPLTLTANKDSYVYVNTLVTSGLVVIPVNNGDPAPVVPISYVPLWKFVTNATNITSSVDLRITDYIDGDRIIDASIFDEKIVNVDISKVDFTTKADYNANFHSIYTNRSLVDKEYVDLAVASFSNIWTDTSTHIYYNTKPVGIGTSLPDLTTALTVSGSFKLVDGTQGVNKVLVSDSTGKASWQLLPNSIITYDEGVVKANTLSSLNFIGSGVTTTSDPAGNIIVSIAGTVSYFDDLFDVQVSGATNKDTLRYNGTNWVKNSVVQNDGNNLAIGNPASITSRLHLYNSSIGGNNLLTAGSVSNPLAVIINDIGSLTVSSQFKYTFGTPGLNKILTSDASGNASWQVPSVPGDLQTITDNGNTTTNSIKLLGSNLIFKSGIYEMSLSGTPTAARAYTLVDDSGTLLYGGGSIGRVPRFSNLYKLENGSIYDDGTNISISAPVDPNYKLNIAGIGTPIGVYVEADNYAVYAYASDVAVYGLSANSGATAIGGVFEAGLATNKYSVQLLDGTQGLNKFLKSVTTDGKANWSTINVSDVTNAVSSTRAINTTSPLLGGGNLSSDLTLSILQASSIQSGFLSNTDWNTFNNKQNALTFDTTPTNGSLNPITSDAVFDSLALKEDTVNKGAINGYASLDSTGKVPATQLPSYVDDVLEYADYASLPEIGTTGKIYITLNDNKIYRWSGSTYIEVSSNLGTVTSVGATGGTGISISGTNPITTSGSFTITNTAPDQVVSLTNGVGISTSGTYPSFTITNTLPDQIVGLTSGTGISITGTYPSFTISNTQPAPTSISTVQHDVKYGVALTKGQAVYVSSADGTNMIVSKADYSTESTSSKTMGLVTEDGALNHQGAVVTEGLLSGIDTSAAGSAGDPVWLGDDGNLLFGLANKPVAPNHMVFIGIVTKKNASTGEIFVKVQNGYELHELHDVSLPSYVSNGVLYRDTVNNLWKTASIETVLGYTPVNQTTTISTSAPLSGGGDLSTNRTLSIADAVADGATKGAATFTASDFNSAAGVISIDYANGQSASSTNKGFLTSTDWSTFNAKQDALVSGTNIKTLEGQSLLGSGNIDLSKSDVGLSNVDNTSDANKPISTATQTALNAKQDTLVSGTNIKTVNGNSLLGSGDLTIGGAITTNLVYVSTTGNDSTGARNDLSKPFLTLEAALSASLSGDTIIVFSGSYTVTTTATNGIAKNGINWYFYPNTTITKSSAGDIFNTTGLTTFNVYGYASFVKNTNAGRIFNNNSGNIAFNFEALDLTNSTSDCFLIGTASQLGGIQINIRIRNATSSAGAVINSGQAGAWNLNFYFNNISSTSTNAITMTNSISIQMNLNGRTITSSAASAYNGGYSNTVTFNVPSIGALNFASGGGTYMINGYCGTVTNAGGNVFVNGIASNITQTGGNFKGSVYSTITCSAGNIECIVEDTGGGAPTHSISGGYVRIFPRYTYFYCNVTGGTFEILGNFSFNHLHGANLTIAGGRLIVNADLTMTAAATGGYSVFLLNSGILDIRSRVSNTISGVLDACVVKYAGGKLILNGATLLTNNTEVSPILVTSAGLSVKVLSGGCSTNRAENGGLLTAKKQKNKLTVTAVASTSITLNDGTGGNETFTESNTATYNTTALLAQRMAALINASATLDITASQDTAGTDTYFYIESDIAGTAFTQSTLTNLTSTNIRYNSFALTNSTGGVIIDDIDVE